MVPSSPMQIYKFSILNHSEIELLLLRKPIVSAFASITSSQSCTMRVRSSARSHSLRILCILCHPYCLPCQIYIYLLLYQLSSTGSSLEYSLSWKLMDMVTSTKYTPRPKRRLEIAVHDGSASEEWSSIRLSRHCLVSDLECWETET